MSVFHGIRDITKLSGPVFFKLAWRLDAYDGAFVKAALMRMNELEQTVDAVVPHEPESRAMTADELKAWDPGPNPVIGLNVGLFEYVRATDA